MLDADPGTLSIASLDQMGEALRIEQAGPDSSEELEGFKSSLNLHFQRLPSGVRQTVGKGYKYSHSRLIRTLDPRECGVAGR